MGSYYVEIRVKTYDECLIDGLQIIADSFNAKSKKRGSGARGMGGSCGPFFGAGFEDKAEALGFMGHICDIDYIQDILLASRR